MRTEQHLKLILPDEFFPEQCIDGLPIVTMMKVKCARIRCMGTMQERPIIRLTDLKNTCKTVKIFHIEMRFSTPANFC